jgi:tetratricopeptide (TPR) repeat protein
MNHKSIIVFVLLLFISIFSFAQKKKLDSLQNVYENLEDTKEKIKLGHQLFKLTVRKEKELGYKYANDQLKISKKINYIKGVGTAYRDIAYYYKYLPNIDSSRYYYEKSVKTFKGNENKESLVTALDRYATLEVAYGNYDKALELVTESQKIATELKNGKMLAQCLMRKSTIYLNKGDFVSAMEVILKAGEISDTINPIDLQLKGHVLSNIGRVERHRGNYKASIEPSKKAVETFIEIKDYKWEMIATNQLGNTYLNLEDYKNALKYYQNSLDLAKELNRKYDMAVTLSNMASIYAKQGNHKKALEMYYNSHKIIEKIGTKSNLITSYNSIGDSNFELKNYTKAIKEYTDGIILGEKIEALDDLNYIYKSRSIAYEKIGEFKLSLYDYKKHQAINDSIFNKTSNDKIEELKAKYESEKKEKEIAIQKSEIQVLKQKEEVSKKQRLLYILGLLSLTIFGTLIYYGVRQKLKRSKLERERLDLELDHKKKELTSHALHLAKKNEVLVNLKQKAKELKDSNSTNYNQLIQTINFDLQDDNNWENFKKYFEEVHTDFNSNVKHKYPEVTSNELRLMALLKMNLTSKEIANILNISNDGIKKARYRLRKKLNLSTEDSLQELVISL